MIKRPELPLHHYPFYWESNLRSLIGNYNQVLECFKQTGIPALLQYLTGIPLRKLELQRQGDYWLTGYTFNPLWSEAYMLAYQLHTWIPVNARPNFKTNGFNGAELEVDLMQGIQVPWPDDGVQAASLKYHRSGRVVLCDGDLILSTEMGRKDLQMNSPINQAIVDIIRRT
jgi:hypothetical protein